ncbi:MAG: DUF6527 family protein [Bacteroidota bacterium]
MKTIKHKFVEFIPMEIEEGTIYISVEYRTAVHLCACGCGNKVVTPLSPTDWEIAFDGMAISLSPSIGNWSFDCKSHYWISKSRIRLARRWSVSEIADNRNTDKVKKNKYFKKRKKS